MKSLFLKGLVSFVLYILPLVSFSYETHEYSEIDGEDFVKMLSSTNNLETNDRGESIKELHKSPFSLGIQLQTKYVWRGMEMQVEEAAPTLFPSIGYSYKGIYAYAMGGYSINGKYAEVDLGVSYTYKWLTIGVNDYFYPTIECPNDLYFKFTKETGHWLEAVITIMPEKIPAYLIVSNFFVGADKNFDGNQAFSTYAEIGAHFDFLYNNCIALAIGTALNKSCYNGYEHNLGICNIELKYTYDVKCKNDWSLPLSVSYILNPVYEKSFVNLTANFNF